MQKIIVLAIVALFALPFFNGCAKDITSSDGSGNIYDFWVGDISFHYERGYHTGVMTAFNPNDIWVWIRVRICDSRCEERRGEIFTLTEYYDTHSWEQNYPPGETIQITMVIDNVTSNNLIRLTKPFVGDAKNVAAYIEGIKMKIGTFNGNFDSGVETNDPTLADYVELTFKVTTF